MHVVVEVSSSLDALCLSGKFEVQQCRVPCMSVFCVRFVCHYEYKDQDELDAPYSLVLTLYNKKALLTHRM